MRIINLIKRLQTTAVFAGLGCSFASNPQLQWRLALGLSGTYDTVLLPQSYSWPTKGDLNLNTNH